MHCKSEAGFTLIEAMIAVAIIGIILVPMFLLQGTILQEVGRRSHELRRMFFARQFFSEARQKQSENAIEYALEKKEENPPTLLAYTLGSIPKNSSLKDTYNLYIERVTATEQGERFGQKLVHFVFKPEREKQ